RSGSATTPPPGRRTNPSRRHEACRGAFAARDTAHSLWFPLITSFFAPRSRAMFRNLWRRLGCRKPMSCGGSPRGLAQRQRFRRPRIEAREDRLVPATHIWTGAGDGIHWSDNNNWNGGAPTTAEFGGTIVQFNGGTDTSDDITGLAVDQIHFTGSGNTIR